MFLSNEQLTTKYQSLLGNVATEEIRKQAWGLLQEQGLPTLKKDDWQYTNVASLNQKSFSFPSPAVKENLSSMAPENIKDCHLVILLNGALVTSPESLPSGVQVYSVDLNADEAEEVFNRKHSALKSSQNSFDLLNLAVLDRLIFLQVEKDTLVEKPVAFVNFVDGTEQQELCINSSIQVVCGSGSSIQIIEATKSLSEASVFTNSMTEVYLQDNSSVGYLRVQKENKDSIHVHHLYSELESGCTFDSFDLSSGTKLSRNNVYVDVKKQNSTVNLNGLYLAEGNQIIDNRTFIEHSAPHTNSHQLYKGVLKDKSRGVFNGVIQINEGSDKVDSSQVNKNLILDNKAEADSKPELRVFADDVKANHGSAIGELDTSEVFYFQSRGISKEDAQKMLTRGYLQEASFKIKNVGLKSIAQIEIDSLMDEYF